MEYKMNKNQTEQELRDEITQLKQQLSLTGNYKAELARAKEEIKDLQNFIVNSNSGKKGEPQKCQDLAKIINELRMSELIVERSPVILFRRLAGEEPRMVYISQNIRRFGYEPKDFLEERISFADIIHPDDHKMVASTIKKYATDDIEEYTMFYRCVTKDGKTRWIEDQTSVVRDENGLKTHNQGVLFDITERKEAEDALRKSEEKFRRIVETAAEGFLLMDEELKIIDFNETFRAMVGYSHEELLGKTPLDITAPNFRNHIAANEQTIKDMEIRKFESCVFSKTGVHIPILIHGNYLRNDNGEIIGNMSFVTDMTEHKKALQLAAEVQKSLLPKGSPDIKGLDIAGRNISCDEIGGDYFDYILRNEVSEKSINVVVGDISGHGLDSALLMTTARAFLRMRAAQSGLISEIIEAMNSHLAKDVMDSGKFMTLFFLTLDPKEKSLKWVRAGHDPAIFYCPKKDTFEELKGKGIALGVTEDAQYIENTRDNIYDDQIIAIGTDGIWEAFNNKGEMFGKERLQQIIRTNAHLTAEEILSKVYDELDLFTAGMKSEDDITLVIIKADGLG